MQYTVLLTELGSRAPAIRDYLERRDGLRLIEVVPSEVDSEGAGSDTIHHTDVMVLGSGMTQPLAVAARLKRHSSHAQIVFLVPTDRMARFRAALPFVPQLSDAWTAAAEDTEEVVGEVIMEAARAARRHNAVASALSNINLQIASKAALGEAARREDQKSISERFMATVLMQAPDPIFAIDPEGEIVSANDAAGRLFSGYQNGTIGKPVLYLFQETVRGVIEELLRRARFGETFERFETLIAVGPGEEATRNATISLASIRNTQGDMDGYALTMCDITDLKRAEQERLLVETEKHAALSRLVAGVAHELNGPVGISITVASTLAERCESFTNQIASAPVRRSQLTDFAGSSRDAAKQLVSNLERAGGLIQAFKQVAVDREHVERRAFELRATTEQVVASVMPGLANPRVTVSLDIPINVTLNSYPDAYRQVLTNLLFNAVNHGFADHQAGIIRITANVIDLDRVQISCSDDGRGIPDEFQRYVFDPFFTTERAKGNIGLGMHIVRNLVTEQLGGRITLDSEAGKGTIISMTLPLTAPSPIEPAIKR